MRSVSSNPELFDHLGAAVDLQQSTTTLNAPGGSKVVLERGHSDVGLQSHKMVSQHYIFPILTSVHHNVKTTNWF